MQLFRKILYPFSLLYALVVYVRNFLFDIGVFTSKIFKTPTICIGNISVGGTGKTPMVEFLISILKKDYQVAVLSRGYKRISKGFVLANNKSTVEELGDEPYQIWNKYVDISLAVDADRQNGISTLEKKIKPDVILLDDAFQHRKVKSGFSVLLTSYSELYVDDWYLPTGNLRDSRREVKRANVIVVTKCPQNLSKEEQENIRKRLQPKENQIVLFSYLEYSAQISSFKENVLLDFFTDKKVTLVTGIANPKPFLEYLNGVNLNYEHLAYKDHHFFSTDEIAMLNKKELILTTEKDYVRLKNTISNLYYIPIKHAFIGDGKEILSETLTAFMKQSS